MRKAVALLLVLLVSLMAPTGMVHAKDEGIFNRSNGCTCHGSSGSLTPSLSGLPTAYTAGTTYALTVGMSGSPATGGFNLEVNKGGFTNPDQNARLSNNALQATHDLSPGTVSWTLDWTAPTTGSGTVQFALAVLSGNNNGGSSGDGYATMTASIQEEVPSNQAPTVTQVAITPAQPTTLDDLTVSYTFNDGDGDGESGTTFAWHINGNLAPSHTSATLPASATSRGESWHVVVTPSDGTDSGTPVSSPSVEVLNSAPVVDITVSSESPDTTEDVSVSFTTDDPDGDPVTETNTRWRLDGVVVDGLDNETVLPTLATRAGDVWDVQVRASDGEVFSAWFTSPSIVVSSNNQAPTVSDVVLLSSSSTSTDDLLLGWTATDDDGDAIVDQEIRWLNGGVEVGEAQDLNPLPSSFTSKGETWTAIVQVSDGEAWSLQVSSPPISVVNAPPTVLSADLVSDSLSARHDLTLNLSSSDEDGDAVTVSDVRWYLDGVEQADAAGETTLPANSMRRGDGWHAVVTVSDGEATTEAATSPVTILNDVPTVSVVWPAAGDALSDLAPSLTAQDADGDGTSLAVSWFKNGFRDASLENITAVPAAKLAPGQTWTVLVQADDGTATGPQVESTYVVPNLAPTAVIDLISSTVWFNEHTELSAMDSSDADGTVVAYRWIWDGQTATGATLRLLLTDDTVVTLTVTDDSGASASTSLDLTVSVGPKVTDVKAFHDGTGEVRLTWEWDGEATMFNILRNEAVVGTTDTLSFIDTPLMSGSNAYTVQPFNDERVYQNGATGISIAVTLDAVEEPAPSTSLGYLLAGVLMLALLITPWLATRTGGDRA